MTSLTSRKFGGGRRRTEPAFTLIELLVVISIISLLISILLPSLGRAREQARGIHCLARLKEFGNAIALYENTSEGMLPPASWFPSAHDLGLSQNELEARERRVEYGWTEILFHYVYSEQVQVANDFPVQRNVEGRRWEKYFHCQSVGHTDVNSGHYRVYLPAWSGVTASPLPDRKRNGETTFSGNPQRSNRRENVRMKLPLLGDANENSERGDGLGNDECSYVAAAEANYAGADGGIDGNRFSDRHHGGTNYLFPDLHAAWNVQLRQELARDFDLDGTIDVDDER